VTAPPYTLTVAGNGAARLRARLLEAQAGSREEPGAPTAPTFSLVVSGTDTGEVVGTARVVAGSSTGNHTLEEASLPPWGAPMPQVAIAAGLQAEHTWDVANMVVDAVRLGGGPAQAEVGLALYHGLWACAATHGARSLTAMLEDRVLARLRCLGIPFRALPGLSPAPHRGGPRTTPSYVHLADVHRSLVGESVVGDYLLHGDGFTHVLVPLPSYWEDHPCLTAVLGRRPAPLPH